MYQLMINHSTRSIEFNDALLEVLVKRFAKKKDFLHLDIKLNNNKLEFKFFIKKDLAGYNYKYFYTSKIEKSFYISGCEHLFLKVPDSVKDDVHGYYMTTVTGQMTTNKINLYLHEQSKITKHERHKYDLSNQKNMIHKVVAYLSELCSNKEDIINASKSKMIEYKLKSGNTFYLQENPFINLHKLLDDYKSNFISKTNFYLLFLKDWHYFKGFDERHFSTLRHYILPYSYIRIYCYGFANYGEYYKRKGNSLYAYAIENFYKNRTSLYDENEYGKVAWVLIEQLLEYLLSYKDDQLDDLILDINAFASNVYRRIDSTEEENMIYKCTYVSPPPKTESQLRDERARLKEENDRLDQWEKEYDARKSDIEWEYRFNSKKR